MKKKKGFTLIELLAVIVILAIIALIAVPVIMNIISKVRQSAFEDTVYGLISAGEMYYAEKLLDAEGMTRDVEFTFTENGISASDNASVLNVKGSIPAGKMTVTKAGKVAIAVDNGVYCITKATSESGITTNEKNGECDYKKVANPLFTTKDTVTEVHKCTTNGQECQLGTKFAVQVNATEKKNFYVVEDEDNVVTLLMDSNLGNNVGWYKEADNTKGPIAALDALEERTKEWTNLPKGYTTEDENTPAKYSQITRSNARARLITKSEANAIISNEWAYSTSYWTSSADANTALGAWYVNGTGSVDNYFVYDTYGLRPVIEIPKTII